MKLRTGEPWMPAPDYGRRLRGLTVNLLVRDIEGALAFQRLVLRADVVYADPDIAVLSGYGAQWMLHADHTYQGHPLHHEIAAVTAKRVGVLIQCFQQLEDLRKLLLIEFLVIGQIAQFDFLDAKLNQDFV